MQRYILFAGSGRHGAGGYDDYIGSRKTVGALKALLKVTSIGRKQAKPRWGDIVDVTTMSRVCSFRNNEWFDNKDLPSHGYDK